MILQHGIAPHRHVPWSCAGMYEANPPCHYLIPSIPFAHLIITFPMAIACSCGQTILRSVYKRHLREVHEKVKKQCPFCKQNYPRVSEHIKRCPSKPDAPPAASRQTPRQCPYCNNSFNRVSEHIKRCPLNPNALLSKWTLRRLRLLTLREHQDRIDPRPEALRARRHASLPLVGLPTALLLMTQVVAHRRK